MRGISSDDAFSALIASTDQPNAKVRQQVISNIASQYKPKALTALKQGLANEKNPAIRSRIISGLTGHNDKKARKLINQALDSESFRHQLADAAVSALRKQDIPANISKIRAATLIMYTPSTRISCVYGSLSPPPARSICKSASSGLGGGNMSE